MPIRFKRSDFRKSDPQSNQLSEITEREHFTFQLVLDAANVMLSTPPERAPSMLASLKQTGDSSALATENPSPIGTSEKPIHQENRTMTRKVRCNINGLEPEQLTEIVESINDAGPLARAVLRKLVEERLIKD